MGGEKPFDNPKIDNCEGSPPRGRGKAYIFSTFWGVERITPAWAGKRDGQDTPGAVAWDHPRVGGEKSRVCPRSDPGTGSPPRGRGKATFWDKVRGKVRITPAWAGKSRTPARSSCKAVDHPRVGGEKSFIYPFPFFRQGSPPRGRGKDHRPPTGSSPSRITPAWAGKSTDTLRLRCISRDHPRVGGEKFMVKLNEGE